MSSDSQSLTSQLPAIISTVIALSSAGIFLLTFSKDKGIHARHSRILEQAKLKIEFWKAWLDIQSKVGSADALTKANSIAREATEIIRNATNENLHRLNIKNPDVPPIGIPNGGDGCSSINYHRN